MKLCKICFQPIDTGVTLKQYFIGDDCICGNCRSQFIENHRTYELEHCIIHAFYIYNEFLENLLFQYKEGRDVALADVFLFRKRRKLHDMIRHRLVVLMPSNEHKIKERGFDHLEGMLGDGFQEICHVLEKSESYKQSEQDFKNKKRIFDVMRIKKRVELPNKDFVLFDDVVTSGSTIQSAARLLAKKGERLHAYVLCVHPRFVELCDENRL